MSGATIDSLKRTLRRLRRRRAALLVLRQGGLFAAALAAAALAASALALWLEPGRTGVLALSGAVAAAALLQAAWLVRVLRRRRGDDRALAHYVEERVPDLEQRLLTSLEFGEGEAAAGRPGVSRQLVRRLWRDAETHVLRRRREVETAAPARGPWLSFAGSAAVVAAAAALIAGHPPLGDAAGRLARPFAGPGEASPAIEIRVEPGSIELRRGDGVAITARIAGAAPDAVTLRLQDDNVNWRDVPMRRDEPDGAVFSHFIASVEKDTTYYVSFNDRDERRSRQHRIALFDLPRVERIDLAFDYPPHTGMDDGTEEDGGDMAVPEGTVVDLAVTFNKPVAAAAAAFDWRSDDGDDPSREDLALALDGAAGSVRFTVRRDGVYRIAATDFAGLRNRDPLEYFVRAVRDEPPELVLRRPGRDQDVMPLEEVIVEADAGDDYGLSEFALRYSVAGGEERRVDLLPEAGARRAAGRELLYLEDLEVEPGDFISYFFTLADNNDLAGPAELVSDIYFLQVIPTDQEFRRARGGGGGGGQGGDDGSALVAIQKDIIAATWKLRNRQGEVPPAEFSADAGVVAASQREATVRARRSIDRLAERLDFSDDTYASAVENLSLAIEQMNLAAAELDLEQVAAALGPEQRALRLILKAEASVNRTDVAMGRGAAGGGRAARREREDLRELFEMEMGRLENRYETLDRAGGSRRQREEAGRLEELARRQEGLSRAQRDLARRAEDMDEERRRRELERLRRRQERLSEEVARLARERSRGAASGPPEPGGAADEPPRTALERAARQMREAARSESPSIAAARGRKALESLRERQRELERQGERSVAQLARGLGERGRELLRRQRELEQAVERTGREQGLGRTRDAAREDEAVAGLLEARQRRQRDLDEINDMLRAVIARGEDRRLLSRAQEASGTLRSVREETRTSDRVLRGGMLGLSQNIEREIGGRIEELARGLSALSPDGEDAAAGLAAQAAREAEALREQLEALERQALSFNEAGGRPAAGAPTVREMRERLARSGELARGLQRRLEEGPGGGAGPAWGGARAIRRELSRREIEDFLNRPELFRRLLEPAAELADALRSRAELDGIGDRLRAAAEEDVPEAYRELVEDYYRALSGTRDADGPSRP